MIRISKQEMKYLTSKGVGYDDDGIVSTTCHHRSWYLTETDKNKSLLKKYRDNILNN